MAKDAWGVIGSACVYPLTPTPLLGSICLQVSVQQVMQDIERAQLKGDASDEELKALWQIILASWRGTRFEVVQILPEVCL